MINGVLPCPFCGEEEAILIPSFQGQYVPEADVSCIGCGARGPFRDAAGARADAKERWNTRTPDPHITRLESDVKVLRARLAASMVAIDDWLHVYASDLCEAVDVSESRKRIGQFGTIGYIAEVQQANREALSRISGEDRHG